MADLLVIQSQIEKLQKQASEIKAREFEGTLRDIIAKMNAFGITVADIQGALGKARKSAISKSRVNATVKPARGQYTKKLGITVAPKYRGPSGETWSGRGLMPRWLSALVAQGEAKEKFAIMN